MFEAVPVLICWCTKPSTPGGLKGKSGYSRPPPPPQSGYVPLGRISSYFTRLFLVAGEHKKGSCCLVILAGRPGNRQFVFDGPSGHRSRGSGSCGPLNPGAAGKMFHISLVPEGGQPRQRSFKTGAIQR